MHVGVAFAADIDPPGFHVLFFEMFPEPFIGVALSGDQVMESQRKFLFTYRTLVRYLFGHDLTSFRRKVLFAPFKMETKTLVIGFVHQRNASVSP